MCLRVYLSLSLCICVTCASFVSVPFYHLSTDTGVYISGGMHLPPTCVILSFSLTLILYSFSLTIFQSIPVSLIIACKFGETGAQWIAQLMMETSALQRLSLECAQYLSYLCHVYLIFLVLLIANRLREKGCKLVSEALRCNRTIQYLNLSCFVSLRCSYVSQHMHNREPH